MKLENSYSKEIVDNNKRCRGKITEINCWINVTVFFGILMSFFIASFFISNGGVSKSEKRNLATFPSIKKVSYEEVFSGEYFKSIESFYNDNFPLREWFLSISSKMEDIKGNRKDEIKIY